MGLDELDKKYLVSKSQIYTQIDENEFEPTSLMNKPSKLECLLGYDAFIGSLHQALTSKKPDDNVIIFSNKGDGALELVKSYCKHFISTNSTENKDIVARYNFENPSKPIVFNMQAGKAKEFAKDLEKTLENIELKIKEHFHYKKQSKEISLLNRMKIKEKKGEEKKGEEEKKEAILTLLKACQAYDKMYLTDPIYKEIEKKYKNENLQKGKRLLKKLNEELKANNQKIKLTDSGLFFLEKEGKIYDRKTNPDLVIPEQYTFFKKWWLKEKNLKGKKIIEKTIVKKEMDILKLLYEDETGVVEMIDSCENYLFEKIDIFNQTGLTPFGKKNIVERVNECNISILQDNKNFKDKIKFVEGDALNLIEILGSIDPIAWSKKEHQRINPGKLIEVSGSSEGKRGILLLKNLDTVLSKPVLGKYLADALLEDSVRCIGSKGDINIDPIKTNTRTIAILDEGIYSRYHFEHTLNGKISQAFKKELTLPDFVKNNEENRKKIAQYIKLKILENDYLDANPRALAKLIEIHLANNSKSKLEIKLDNLVDLYSSANYFAHQNNNSEITEEHILKAYEMSIREKEGIKQTYNDFKSRSHFPDKKEVGVIGGMSIINYKLVCGSPFRIFVSAIENKKKGLRFYNIEQKSKLAGKTFVKGFEQVIQLLKNKHGTKINSDLYLSYPESFNSHDGPSASTAINVACLSALSNEPIYPYTFFTGALDPVDGKVLKIGGLNEKIMGVVDLILNKDINEAVIGFPRDNLTDLQLVLDNYREVIDSKRIRLYSFDHIDEALEIATRKNVSEIYKKIK